MLNKEVIDITNKYFGICYGIEGFEAHKNLWDVYNSEKSLQLQKLFGDKLIVEKEVEFEKPISYIKADLINAEFGFDVYNALDQEWRDLMIEYPRLFVADSMFTEETSQEERQKTIMSAELQRMVRNDRLAENKVSEDVEYFNPKTGKTFKLKEGEKITRALKHFISDKEKLNAIQVKYSQLVNTRRLKGTLCLSIHPLDYMTVSVNNSGWTSCFNSLDRGEYCASTLCLMSSPNTMVAYLKSKDDMDIYRAMKWNNKKWRALVTLGENNESVHVGRNYPYNSPDLIAEVMNMVEELSGKKYAGVELCSKKIEIDTPYNMYNDTRHDAYSVGTTDAWYNKFGEEGECVHISEVGAICPKCGEPYDYNEADIVCDECFDGDRCDDCGHPMSDGGTYIPSIDGYVCDCCLEDNYGYCDHCDEYAPYEDIHEVERAVSERLKKMNVYGGNPTYWECWCQCCIDAAIEDGELYYDDDKCAYREKVLEGR